MKKIFGFIITILVLILYGCEYKSDEIFFRNVNKNVALPDLKINLNLTSDTTYFYRTPGVVLSLELTNKEIYGVKFFVNNVEVNNVYRDQQNYSISIDASSNNNLMKVKAEIYTSTGTGSIGDKVKAESYVFQTKEWVLIYVPEQPVLKTEIVDGRLKLSWTPIKSSVKSKYYIYSSNHSKYLIDSTYNNWYIDSSFYGGNNNISIQYGKNDISGYYVYGDFTYQLPFVTVTNRDSFLISWDKCKFYNSINGFRLRIGTDTINFKSTETRYVYKNGRFGENYLVAMDLWLKNTNYFPYSYYLNYTSLFAYYPSSFLPDYAFFSGNYFPLTGSSFYYRNSINNQTYLFKFSLDSKSSIASKELWTNDFSVSPNNKYIFYEDETSNLKLLETNELELVTSIPTSQIVSYPGIFNIVIFDIGTSAFYDQSKHILIVYDIIGNKTVVEIPAPNLTNQYKISAGGKYIFQPEINALYKVENNSYTTVWSNEGIGNQFKYFDFFPDDQEKICLYDGSSFFIKNSSDFSTINTFSIKDKNIVNVDFPDQKILTLANSNYYIYSLATGNLLRTIPTSIYYSDRVRLFNDYIIYDYCQLNLKYQ